MISSKLSPSEERAALESQQTKTDKRETPIAILEGKKFHYVVMKQKTTIGRRKSSQHVDVEIGKTKHISRHHLTLTFDRPKFYLDCHSKNGVFVDSDSRIKLEEGSLLQLPTM